ncbi:putative Integral membrane protein [Seiridium unicorne]|uniref:Integral membrane protein n=1 Tax=Seiridium unicorne TaxID=138068 RepID=A0ABR2UPP4_9PEZI
MAFPIVNGTEVIMEPPEGYHVDFAHPTYDTSTINSHYWAFGIEFPIATLFLAQRVYTSLFVLRKFRIDDYMIIVAWVFTTAAQCMILHCVDQGILGVHIWEISSDKAIYETTLIHATTLTVIPGTVLAKLVLCIFYYRLSPVVWYRYTIAFTAFVTVAAFTSVWCSVQFACKPIEAAWDLRLYTGDNCISRPPVYMLQAVMGGITDLLLMVLPIQTVVGLQMSLKYKFALLCWFGTGLITLGAALARLVVLVPALQDSDTTWVLGPGTLWLIVEANLIIICGTLPTFKVFLNHIAPKLLRDSKNTSNGSEWSGRNKRTGGNENGIRYALRTFGSSQTKRRQFDTIDEIEHGDNADRRWKPTLDSQAEDVKGANRTKSQYSDEEAIMPNTISTTESYATR